MEEAKEFISDIKQTLFLRRLTIASFFLLIFAMGIINSSENYFLSVPSITLLWLFLWFISNIIFGILVPKFKDKKKIEVVYCIYILLEYLFLSLTVYYIGGITWVGGFFYWFTMMYAALHLPKKKAIALVFLGIFMFNIIVFLEFFGFLPHSSFLPNAPYNNIKYVFVSLTIVDIYLVYVGIVANMIRSLFEQKRRQLEKAYSKIEEEKKILEIKVSARTKESFDLSKELKEKVKEKTADLNRKMKELEKMQYLVKGREEKLISLRKEAEFLKNKLSLPKKEN